MELRFSRVVDLSHPLTPGVEGRKFVARRVHAEDIAPVQRLPHQWYIMHELELVNHLGTHIEVPYHLLEDGFDLAGFSPDRTIRSAVILGLPDLPAGHAITLGEVQAAADQAGGIQEGGFVFLHTGWDKSYGTPEYAQGPCVEVRAIQWLVNQRMSLLGIDTAGVERLDSAEHESHLALFEHGVPLVENLRGLEQLEGSQRCAAVVAPIAMKGIDAIPVRVLGFI